SARAHRRSRPFLPETAGGRGGVVVRGPGGAVRTRNPIHHGRGMERRRRAPVVLERAVVGGSVGGPWSTMGFVAVAAAARRQGAPRPGGPRRHAGGSIG